MAHEHHHDHDAACHHDSCEHHHHDHEHGSLRRQLLLILVTALLLAGCVLAVHRFALPVWQQLLLFLVPYLLIGHSTLKEAWEGLVSGDAFNEHFLMSVATIGALCIGFLPGAETQFPEAVFVMLFFQVGELFEGYAEGKSRESIAHLMDIRPDVAHVMEEGGSQECDVHPSEVRVGQTVVVRPGEKVPLDGVVIQGTSALNTMALTGESMPLDVGTGDSVVSGSVNLSGVLLVRTTKSFGESTATKIIELVEHAAIHKSKSETFITRFARIYTPVVVAAALLLTVVPPLVLLFTAHLPFAETFPTWLYRALLFLVVSCPCALVISVPLTFFGGIGGASRRGILIKGANFMDVLSKVDTVVFDKTGTLTHGQFVVEAVHPETLDEHQLLHLAAHVEHYSSHPIGAALRQAFPDEATDGCTVADVEEIAGQGIRARVGDLLVCVGNTKLMEAVGAQWRPCEHVGTIIHVAVADGAAPTQSSPITLHPSPFTYAGHIVINDQLKADSRDAISQLKALGVVRTVMLTGDRREVGEHVARQLGIDECYTELLPDQKVEYVEQFTVHGSQSAVHGSQSAVHGSPFILHSSLGRSPHPCLAFVGDGINDAPVLARADVGIAMGGLGSDAAIEAADVVIMDDQPSKVPAAIAVARRTIGIARQNVWLAIGVKVAVLLLATFGLATMWMAVFADVGVTVLAVLNAMRALRVG